ncbi:DinB family protein [Aureibaculum sp. 2210JD6-5]|uniref:DinB family protein n=1 Tax=Aureibaculum sp. 2210JD6-5 TaxID=3103957 RepID=UPI002AADA7CC|nr:DinB family protein [Aureibaculum sp. 2210JD6-5]MDY7396530.1 DinB family protein [Aureibaculum sp. 2210JD6-5]
MDKQFDILKANRLLILKIIDGLTIKQLNKIPTGFKNNIVWNVAHLVVTHQLLCYRFSGLPLYISDEMVEKYKKGTAPKNDIDLEEFEQIKTRFLSLPDKFVQDYENGTFKTYRSYTTSANVTLNSISDAIEFNNFHEGIHLGYILALKKLV